MASPSHPQIPDPRFELVQEYVSTDLKRRITLGSATPAGHQAYNIYRNTSGQLLLDPVVTVPTWRSAETANHPINPA